MNKKLKILVTGSSGFIGFHLSKYLLDLGHEVFGIDSLTDYYDVSLKNQRQKILTKFSNFKVGNFCLTNRKMLDEFLCQNCPNIVVHLAAQAGVRHSLENPRSYLEYNINATFELIDSLKNRSIQHFLFSSTSSVYGLTDTESFTETQKADEQISFYASSKKCCENILQSYSHTHEIPTTAFRFFTVYGPWGRPDMALYKFTKNILVGKDIDVYNFGKMSRDFTYVDDLVKIIERIIPCAPIAGKKISKYDTILTQAPYRLVNLGYNSSVELVQYIKYLEAELDLEAKKNMLPMQPGDVSSTCADNSLLKSIISMPKQTEISVGIRNFVKWYHEFHGNNLV